MECDDTVKCKLFKKEIDTGLCTEVVAVMCKMLKFDSVPEIKDFTREDIENACNSCPYID